MLRLLVNPTNNMSKTNLQQQITVHALPSKVWKVLTGAEYINQYFFDGNINSDWTEGSSIFFAEEDTEELKNKHHNGGQRKTGKKGSGTSHS